MATYLLDIENDDRPLRIERLHVGDNGIRALEFIFVKGAKHFDLPQDCVATLYAVLPDGSTILDSCDVAGDRVVYTVTGGTEHPTLTSYAGESKCEIRLTFPDGKCLTSPSFSVFCDGVLLNDGTVEAQESFSALTDALSRVCNAESGLSSKLDKTAGAEGNMVVFGPDSSIADGGPASRIYSVPYYDDPTDEQKETIKETVDRIRSEKGAYSIQMVFNNMNGYTVPAQNLITSGTSNIIAVLRGLMDPEHATKYNIQLTASGGVRCWSEDIVGGSGASGEDGATFTPSVSEDGILSWSNDKGLADPASVNIRGPQGPKGEDGAKGDKGDTGDKGDKGDKGERGTGILKITASPSAYTTATGGFTPAYRIALSTVKTQSKATEVLVGDTVAYSYYQYPVGYVDSSYVYLGARISVRGSTGAAGAAGADGYTPVKGTDYYTDEDKAEMVNAVIAALPRYTGGVS